MDDYFEIENIASGLEIPFFSLRNAVNGSTWFNDSVSFKKLIKIEEDYRTIRFVTSFFMTAVSSQDVSPYIEVYYYNIFFSDYSGLDHNQLTKKSSLLKSQDNPIRTAIAIPGSAFIYYADLNYITVS